MKLVRRAGCNVFVCEDHVQDGDLVLGDTRLGTCVSCNTLSLAEQWERILQAETRLRQLMDRWAELVGPRTTAAAKG